MKRHVGCAVLVACLILLPRAVSAQSDCDPRPLIDENGQLNPAHPDAGNVLAALARFNGRFEELIPAGIDPRDTQIIAERLRSLEREMTGTLLTFMDRAALVRFAPWLRPLRLGDGGGSSTVDPGDVGGTAIACTLAKILLDDARESISGLAGSIDHVAQECSLVPGEDYTCRIPSALNGFLHAIQFLHKAEDLVRKASEAYTNQNPCQALTHMESAAAYLEAAIRNLWGHYLGCDIHQLVQGSTPDVEICDDERDVAVGLMQARDLVQMGINRLSACCDTP